MNTQFKNRKINRVTKTNLAVSLFAALAFQSSQLHAQDVSNIKQTTNASLADEALYNNAAMAAAKKNLRIVFFGSERLKKQINSAVSDWALDDNGSQQIVVVESGKQDKNLIMRLLAKGNIVISVGNAPVDTTKRAFARLVDIANGGSPTKSNAEYEANQFNSSVTTTADDTLGAKMDSERDEMPVSAYFYSPIGSRVFASNDRNIVLAMADALQWAVKDDVSQTTQIAKAASWERQFTRDNTVRCPDGTYIAGTLNIKTEFFKRLGDGSTSDDYWYIRFIAQMVPGTYRNADVSTWSDASTGGGYTFSLRDYDPTTTSGDVSLGSDGLTASWAYSIADIIVKDKSNFSTNYLSWIHDINQLTFVGTNTVKVEPGALIRVPQGVYLPSRLDEHHKAQFYKWSGLSWKTKSCQIDLN